MSERGRLIHVRGGRRRDVERGLRRLGIPMAILGRNRLWTTVAPIECEIDASAVAASTARGVLEVWFDDDSGLNLVAATPTERLGELALVLDDLGLSERDHGLLERLVEVGLVSRGRSEKISRALGSNSPDVERVRWVQQHGVESELGVPVLHPAPIPFTMDELPAEAQVVGTTEGNRGEVPQGLSRTDTSAPVELGPCQARVADLHFFYLTKVWNANVWTVYSRYKKHLPRERRSEVDRLCDFVVMGMGDATEARARLDSILAAIWDAEDWLALISNPKLLESDFVSEATRERWERQLATARTELEGLM